MGGGTLRVKAHGKIGGKNLIRNGNIAQPRILTHVLNADLGEQRMELNGISQIFPLSSEKGSNSWLSGYRLCRKPLYPEGRTSIADADRAVETGTRPTAE